MRRVSISYGDEVVAELFRDDGTLLGGHWLGVGGDDDGLHLVSKMIMAMRMMTRVVRMLRMVKIVMRKRARMTREEMELLSPF